MITTRTAKQCGQSRLRLAAGLHLLFGHYFDPKLGFASLRVLNREVLAPGASFEPERTQKSIS